MDPDRWARAKELFHEALEREPERRDAFLLDVCARDESLREAVQWMLAREARASRFLEVPALHVEALALAEDLRRSSASDAGQSAGLPPVPSRLRALDHAGVPPLTPRRASTRPPWWLFLVATILVADALLRTWCHLAGPEFFGFTPRLEDGRWVVTTVVAGGSADRAGMRPGDIVVARDGRPFAWVPDRWVLRPNLEGGRAYRFETERGGQPRTVMLAPQRVRVLQMQPWDPAALWQVAMVALVGTGLFIAFRRPADPQALGGALALAALGLSLSFSFLPAGYAAAWRAAAWGLGALLIVPTGLASIAGPIGLTFFLLFPRPLFRARWPWLLVWLPALYLVPAHVVTTLLIVYRPEDAFSLVDPEWVQRVGVAVFAVYGLSMLAAITGNYIRLTDANDRRRVRVLIAGGAAGTLPSLLLLLLMALAPESAARGFLASAVPAVLIAVMFLLFPVSFAYVLLRRRVLGVRVIARAGVQYALARGVVLSLVPALGAALAADALIHGNQPLIRVVAERGWIYGVLAGVAVVVHGLRRRVANAIDRRFFREQYDARRLLGDVAEQARRADSLEAAAPAVVSRIEAALHPAVVALLVRPSGETRFQVVASAPAGARLPAIGESNPLAVRLRATGKLVQPSGWFALGEDAPARNGGEEGGEHRDSGRGLPVPGASAQGPAGIDLLMPIVMSPEGADDEALLALGPRRSVEPYTQEDLDALAAIAASLAPVVGRPPTRERLSSGFEECPACGVCYDTGTATCGRENRPLVPVGMPRTLAGRYRLERRLGRGGMGKVYEATDTALKRRVAVKVIRDEWVHSTAAVDRFRREARAAAGLDHPHVVTVHDYGVETGRRAFLVMELLDGVTLRDEIRRRGRLEAARTVEVFRGVCSAVEAAHRHQIVHRDLKPENIFLVPASEGHEATVKVLDFGVAKPLPGTEGEGDGAVETDVGVLVGTVGYMAPEQLLGDRADVSWDLWALAVVAYESLAGALPFPVTSRETWRHLVLAGRPSPLRAHLADAPPAWQAFFDRCFSADRAARPRSAAQFIDDLEAALTGATVPGIGAVAGEGVRAAIAGRRSVGGPGLAVADPTAPAVLAPGGPLPPGALPREEPELASTHGHEQAKAAHRDPAWNQIVRLRLLSRARQLARPGRWMAWREHPRPTTWMVGAIALAGVAAAVGLLALGRRQPPAAAAPRLLNVFKVTSALGVEDDPSWSPDGRALAYQSDQSGNWDIWVTELGSGQAVNRTADCGVDDMRPSWSPDGQWIAFFSQREGGGYFVMPAVGGRARRVAPWTAGEENPTVPQWSPDGSQIAYARGQGSEPWLEVLTLASRATRKIPLPSRPTNNAVLDLSWSPDGRWLAYARAISNLAANAELCLTRVSDGESLQLTPGTARDFHPTWSPDSRVLWFVSNRGGVSDLWRYTLGATGAPQEPPRQVSAGLEVLGAVLYADGMRLAFTKGRLVRNVARAPILADRPATWSDTTPITSDVADFETVDVSPDGRLVVSSDRSGNWDLWTMSSDGGDLTPLTTDPALDAGPQWKPDGREVVFHSSRSGHRELWIQPVGGGPAKQLTRGNEESWYPAWSPDGREVIARRPRGLAVVSVQDGRARPLTNGPSDTLPSWSPDSRWVVFRSSRDGARRVWRVPASGGPPERLTAHKAESARWSPDGREVYFIGAESTSDGIWALSLESRRERQITSLVGRRGRLGAQGLATDGRYVYFMWEEARGDIWVADLQPPGR